MTRIPADLLATEDVLTLLTRTITEARNAHPHDTIHDGHGNRPGTSLYDAIRVANDESIEARRALWEKHPGDTAEAVLAHVTEEALQAAAAWITVAHRAQQDTAPTWHEHLTHLLDACTTCTPPPTECDTMSHG